MIFILSSVLVLIVLLFFWWVYAMQLKRIEYLEKFNKETSTQILFHFNAQMEWIDKPGVRERQRRESRASGLMSAFRLSTRYCKEMDSWVIPFDLKRYTRKFRR